MEAIDVQGAASEALKVLEQYLAIPFENWYSPENGGGLIQDPDTGEVFGRFGATPSIGLRYPLKVTPAGLRFNPELPVPTAIADAARLLLSVTKGKPSPMTQKQIREYWRKQRAQRREAARKAGKCILCLKNQADNGLTSCAGCRSKSSS